MTTLYARHIVLRNCGRFSVVQSDFGADYRTHTHVTSAALYASLTRGVTWQPHPIIIQQDDYGFMRDYKVQEMPLWFTPGIFHHEEYGPHLPTEDLDSTFFNAVSEVYPATSKAFAFDKKQGELRQLPSGRPGHIPTYGTWQAVLPNHHLFTFVFSPSPKLLASFEQNQTFLLGKKRAMFQIMGLSPVVEGKWSKGQCQTDWLELSPAYSRHFQRFEILTATLRYIILRGETEGNSDYLEFSLVNEKFCLPDFYLKQTPIWMLDENA